MKLKELMEKNHQKIGKQSYKLRATFPDGTHGTRLMETKESARVAMVNDAIALLTEAIAMSPAETAYVYLGNKEETGKMVEIRPAYGGYVVSEHHVGTHVQGELVVDQEEARAKQNRALIEMTRYALMRSEVIRKPVRIRKGAVLCDIDPTGYAVIKNGNEFIRAWKIRPGYWPVKEKI